MLKYITQDGDMLDAICIAQYGRSSGVVEAVLVANPGLASVGPVLPEGLTIVLPDKVDDYVLTETTPSLWD